MVVAGWGWRFVMPILWIALVGGIIWTVVEVTRRRTVTASYGLIHSRSWPSGWPKGEIDEAECT
jgi:hypothetical protein